MARRLLVEVLVDPANFKRGMKESAAMAGQFEGKLKSLSRTAMTVGSSLVGMGAGIGGQTASSYTIVSGDIGYVIRLKETAHNSGTT